MKIVLLGYMASGKSTIGKLLAKKIELPFVDLDDYISEKEKKSIPEIFEEKGEIYFRTIENKYLKEYLNKNENFVLSLGGGTPCYANNMQVLKDNNVHSIYLQSSIATLVKRLLENRSKRPLIANVEVEKVPEFVAKHLFERRFFYEQASITLKIDNKTKKEIITELRILLY
ncbi:AAA family ATPase [Polaribacter sp. MSW13]|uniref:Shikimate kinase n=1 Tax=Polaribacter marinus TaxID=2916838 RepID=A0A9X1VLR8_9FLAO|nr:shikimate kinase [Polaribacter marinus]MCI2228452.1 AAA family ATPase [Polaribacter marinus]